MDIKVIVLIISTMALLINLYSLLSSKRGGLGWASVAGSLSVVVIAACALLGVW